MMDYPRINSENLVKNMRNETRKQRNRGRPKEIWNNAVRKILMKKEKNMEKGKEKSHKYKGYD